MPLSIANIGLHSEGKDKLSTFLIKYLGILITCFDDCFEPFRFTNEDFYYLSHEIWFTAKAKKINLN